ncbi:hypothetical protein GOP47_0012647 [Adiantum capillus-veneris]|uniref:Fungal lipase-type domain-containing protein n=1 Tax=Adiantum capillus-veneris TaxID=13818 RepID=A0A9D4URP9_ADICA|nr:hypothetical protein GOP47_0012647 [Adiantum capillus-veneris]
MASVKITLLDVVADAAKRALHFFNDANNSESSSEEWSSSDSDDSNIDAHGRRSERQIHKEVFGIKDFVEMAGAAYSDLSMAAYFPSIVRKSQLIKNMKERSAMYKKSNIGTDTGVHVCLLKDGSLAFTFRGTELSWPDWSSFIADAATDVMVEQIPMELYNASHTPMYHSPPHVKAHKGFQLAFRDVTKTSRPNENLQRVAEGLGAHTPSVRRVICIGHGLGGALATLCAHWCRYVAYPKAEIWCVTIGSPRVGNRAFAKDFHKNVVNKGRSYRVVNKDDVIPNMPRFDLISHGRNVYKHVRGFIHFDEKNPHTITLKHGGRRHPILSYACSLKDHSAHSYKDSLHRMLNRFPHLH